MVRVWRSALNESQDSAEVKMGCLSTYNVNLPESAIDLFGQYLNGYEAVLFRSGKSKNSEPVHDCTRLIFPKLENKVFTWIQ